MYSSVWNKAQGRWGALALTILPFSTLQPLETAMMPLTAMTVSSSRTGMIHCEMASSDSTQSTSVLMKYG